MACSSLGSGRAATPVSRLGSRLGAVSCWAVILLLGATSLASARKHPLDGDYCPKEPATGQLAFKSVDSENSACMPSMHDVVGLAVYECWRQFVIEVNGCEVVMRTDPTLFTGPGRLPCSMFGLNGNLTTDGMEARMWVQVDGEGLLDYYADSPEAVTALQYDTPQQVVRDIWAFLRDFTADVRFADDAWIDGPTRKKGSTSKPRAGHHGSSSLPHHLEDAANEVTAAGEAQEAQEQEGKQEGERDTPRAADRRLLVSSSSSASGGVSVRGPFGATRAPKGHGPMRVYRPTATRVSLKVPNGCKYKYTVNPTSRIFESPARERAHLQWRTIALTVAFLSVMLSVVGLGACTYLSRRHAEYVSSYWEYQAVKDQLGSELSPNVYERLFGELPKTAAAAAEAAAAASVAAAAARAQKSAAAGAGAAAAAGASAATAAAGAGPAGPAVAGVPVLLPPVVVRQSAAAGLHAEAGEAPIIGAMDDVENVDGISSRSSSAAGSEVAAAVEAVVAAESASRAGALP